VASSAVEGGSGMAGEDAVEWVGEEGDGAVACLEDEEDRRLADTKLSRASAPSVAGPWLRSSYCGNGGARFLAPKQGVSE
jgi:hypothetical protein